MSRASFGVGGKLLYLKSERKLKWILGVIEGCLNINDEIGAFGKMLFLVHTINL